MNVIENLQIVNQESLGSSIPDSAPKIAKNIEGGSTLRTY